MYPNFQGQRVKGQGHSVTTYQHKNATIQARISCRRSNLVKIIPEPNAHVQGHKVKYSKIAITSPRNVRLHSNFAQSFISERELMFTFAICRRPSVCRLSVCRLSVTFVHPTQAIEIFGIVSTPFGTLAICDPSVKILRISSQGNPSVGGLNRRGVAKYSVFGPLRGYISRKRCKIGGKLLLMTNRKSHMSFRLVPNSVT